MTKMYLDTSTNLVKLQLGEKSYEWDAGHDMARNLQKYIADQLAFQHKTWQDLSEITFFSGPGSFTGLRIGAAIVNALADQLDIPLYDHHGQRHQIILPDYGRPANISQPRK